MGKIEQPRIIIVTLPIRPAPTSHPPIGSLCVVTALRKMGLEEVEFYDIDGLRPSYEEVLEHIKERKPDILGISAIVSTSYEYSKNLSQDVKKILPNTIIVLGGPLAAASELILRKTGVDVCCVGEGETMMTNFVELCADSGFDKKKLADIPGIAYLDDDQFKMTGFAEQLDKEKIYDIDWDIVDEAGIRDVLYRNKNEDLGQFTCDPRFYDPERRGKSYGRYITSKGCVARCTFCHRFAKGIRYLPLEILKFRLEDFIKRFDLGFISFSDENFGIHDRWLEPFCAMMKEFNVLWSAGGIRVRQMTPQKLKMMHDSGCVVVGYGIETGSEKMLAIMEKKIPLEDNYNVTRWTIEENMGDGIQLVIGMPGESPSTIRETQNFCKITQSVSPSVNPVNCQVNYAQALPGTPLYEIARHRGIIGTTINDEEKYLLSVSNKNARNANSTLNFTDYPRVVLEAWRLQIMISNLYHYVKNFGAECFNQHIMKHRVGNECILDKDSIYFANVDRLTSLGLPWNEIDEVTRKADMKTLKGPSFWSSLRAGDFTQAMYAIPRLAYYLRWFVPTAILLKNLVRFKFKALPEVKEYLIYLIMKPFNRIESSSPPKSLRKTVNETSSISTDDLLMDPLRKGR